MTTSIPMDDLFDKKWAEVDPEVRERAVEVLRTELHPTTLQEIRDLVAIHGRHDWAPPEFHFSGGMAIRNLLRKHGVRDAMFPAFDEYYGAGTDIRNLDDYYMQALVEAATGN